MSIKKVKASKITPTMEGWFGEATEVFKETESGIPTGKLSIIWVSETGQHTETYEKEEIVEVFKR